MTSTRAPVPPVDLKARIAAFQESQKAANAKQTTPSASATLPKPSASSGNTNLRDRIASFEKQGAVPVPKSRFGFAPIPQNDEPAPLKRHGELYGNRIPGLSRPHLPVPLPSKGDKRSSSKPRNSTRLELERFTTSPSPPGSPFLTSENGESVGDALSDGEPASANDLSGASEEDAQPSPSTLVSPPPSDTQEDEQPIQSPPADGESSHPVSEQSDEASASNAAEQTDVSVAAPADEHVELPPVVVAISEPAELGSSSNGEETAPASTELGDPQVQAETEGTEASSEPTVVVSEPTNASPEQLSGFQSSVADSEALDPAVQAVIEQLDRATQSGDAGAVVVPSSALQTLATLGKAQQKSVQEMLDQLLLQQDVIDIATPVKQRFSLNGQLSSQAVLDYLAQQNNLSKDANPTTPPRKSEALHDQAGAPQPQPNQFLSPTTPSVYSADSPVSEEPLSPASDIYSAYATTPAVVEKFSRALPAIPEAPDSPEAFKAIRRGTFGAEGDGISTGSSAPTSAPVSTPSDDGLFSEQQDSKRGKRDDQESVAPSDGMVRIAGTPPRLMSPPLSVVIPHAAVPKPARPAKKDAEDTLAPTAPDLSIVKDSRVTESQTGAQVANGPASKSASGSSSSSPASTCSPNSTYSGDGTSPSSTGPVSRKGSTSSRGRRSHAVSPLLPSAPFEEPELTPIEGPKGFRAVVHGKVVEGKNRPVSMNVQYPDLPSPSPLNASGMGDLAALLADAAMLEKQLADVRTPSKNPRAVPRAPQPTSTSPPPASGRTTSDRPKPAQDLPESPDDQDLFGKVSQPERQPQEPSEQRASHMSGRPLPEHPRPSRPSIDRTLERKSSRPSLDQKPSRSSLDQVPPSAEQSGTLRPSTDSTSSRPQLQPMFLTADPNAVRIPLPPRPKSAMSHSSSARGQTSTPPPPPKSPPRTGYLTNLLSRAKSSGNLRPSAESRDSMGSSSEDSVTIATPSTPPYDVTSVSETGSVRSSRMFKNSFSRATNFADKLLNRKDGSNPSPEVAIASGDEEDSQLISQRALPRPPRPLPLPPQPQPPRGLPPPVPAISTPNPNNIASIPPPGQPPLSRRASWKSIASVSTTGISEALDTSNIFDSFPAVPDGAPRRAVPASGLPAGPTAYTAPRPAPLPPLPPPNQPLPPPPSQPLPPPPRGASYSAVHSIPPGGRPGLPANPASRPKTLPSRPKVPPQQLRSGMI
ncbi:hypothetical protein BD414DRAFT_318632 [Trametes punicea]|nr:hypothetical protein BD414DRAFT_318632 [Trametes punicea]